MDNLGKVVCARGSDQCALTIGPNPPHVKQSPAVASTASDEPSSHPAEVPRSCIPQSIRDRAATEMSQVSLEVPERTPLAHHRKLRLPDLTRSSLPPPPFPVYSSHTTFLPRGTSTQKHQIKEKD